MKLQKRYSSLSYCASDLMDSVISLTNNSPIETSIVVPNIGSGNFFRKIVDKFPILSESLNVQKKKPGEITTTEIFKSNHNKVYFCQMYCEKQKTRSRSIDYVFLFKAMLNLKYFCIEKHKTEERRVEIHLPKNCITSIGGRWSTFADLIEDCWVGQGIHTFIYRND